MQRIKLDATDSTNAYLKKLMLSEKLEDFTFVKDKKVDFENAADQGELDRFD